MRYMVSNYTLPTVSLCLSVSVFVWTYFSAYVSRPTCRAVLDRVWERLDTQLVVIIPASTKEVTAWELATIGYKVTTLYNKEVHWHLCHLYVIFPRQNDINMQLSFLEKIDPIIVFRTDNWLSFNIPVIEILWTFKDTCMILIFQTV